MGGFLFRVHGHPNKHVPTSPLPASLELVMLAFRWTGQTNKNTRSRGKGHGAAKASPHGHRLVGLVMHLEPHFLK